MSKNLYLGSPSRSGNAPLVWAMAIATVAIMLIAVSPWSVHLVGGRRVGTDLPPTMKSVNPGDLGVSGDPFNVNAPIDPWMEGHYGGGGDSVAKREEAQRKRRAQFIDLRGVAPN